MSELKIAVFASGTGTNAKNLYCYFDKSPVAKVSHLVCNNPHAPVLDLFKETEVKKIIVSKEEFNNEGFLKQLGEVQLIVLAGFIWLIPSYLIKAFPNRIINLHPSLLPKFGGKGMYGMHVHRAVINAAETSSGITIHLVNEEYDKGEILFQKSVQLDKEENPETLAKKINQLELASFPSVIENYILSTAINSRP